MQQNDLDFEFDPYYSEFHPLSKEIQEELKGLIEPERKEDTGFCASIIRKLMPCF